MPDLTLPLAEIKKRLSEVVDGVEDRHDRVVLLEMAGWRP